MYVYMHQEINDKSHKNKIPPYYHETMMFHTRIRNVGLYTSLTLAALAASRALMTRGHNSVAMALIAVAMIFMGLAIEMNRPLLWPTPLQTEAPTSQNIPWILATAHAMMCIAIGVTAWRGFKEFRK